MYLFMLIYFDCIYMLKTAASDSKDQIIRLCMVNDMFEERYFVGLK